MSLKYLSADEAVTLDQKLMGEFGFSIDQLMELAGLSVAQAIEMLYKVDRYSHVLIIAGPGNNGGDGLVCARHLWHFGYTPIICYPKKKKNDLYSRLLTQCRSLGIKVFDNIEEIETEDFHMVLDAIFGFSFDPSQGIRRPFDNVIRHMVSFQEKRKLPIVSIDVPSGWHVNKGDILKTGLQPDCLVSLTAPKTTAQFFTGRYHVLGGRFVPPVIEKEYSLNLPSYSGSAQCVLLDKGANIRKENLKSANMKRENLKSPEILQPEKTDTVLSPDSTKEFAATVHLDPVEVNSGEQNEKTIWEGVCTLYSFDSGSQEWKQRGKGNCKMLQHKKQNQIRILLREDKTFTLRMNHIINPSVHLSPYSNAENAWTWSAIDFAKDSEKGVSETFAIRFKIKELSQTFHKKYEEAQEINSKLSVQTTIENQNKKNDDETKERKLEEISPSKEQFVPKEDLCSEKKNELAFKSNEIMDNNAQDENIFWQGACTLYSYDSSMEEWKQRGKGDCKMLQQKTQDQIQMILREDKTFTLRMNHTINPSIFLSPHNDSQNAWSWSAMDFSVDEEKGVNETFAIRFASKELAHAFQMKYEEAQKLNSKSLGQTNKEEPEETTQGKNSPLNKQAASEFENKSSLPPLGSFVSNIGSWFSWNKKAPENEIPINQDKKQETKDQNDQKTTHIDANILKEDDVGSKYTPVVHLEPKEIDSGESDEDIFWTGACTLYRYSKDTVEWKQRGKGNCKMLQNRKNNQIRILLRENKTFKLRMNHVINPSLNLSPFVGYENAWTWSAHDFAEDKEINEIFAIRFKIEKLSQEFQSKYAEAQKINSKLSKKQQRPQRPQRPQQPQTQQKKQESQTMTAGKKLEMTHGGLLFTHNFWEIEEEAPILKLDNDFLETQKRNNYIDLERKLLQWLNDAEVTPTTILDVSAAFSVFIKKQSDDKIEAKRIFVLDAERCFRSDKNRKLLIDVLSYLEHKFGDYHQGLGLVAGFLLLIADAPTTISLLIQFESEERYLFGGWKAEAIKMATDAYVFQWLLNRFSPDVCSHLESMLIMPEMYYQKYFCALAVHVLPFEALYVFFDHFAQEGYLYIFKFMLNLASQLKDDLLRARDQALILNLLRLEDEDACNHHVCMSITSNKLDTFDLSNFEFSKLRDDAFKTHLKDRIENARIAFSHMEDDEIDITENEKKLEQDPEKPDTNISATNAELPNIIDGADTAFTAKFENEAGKQNFASGFSWGKEPEEAFTFAPATFGNNKGQAAEAKKKSEMFPQLKLDEAREQGEYLFWKGDGKLYLFSHQENEWKQRGIGSLKMLKCKGSSQIQMIFRESKTHRLRMNNIIDPRVILLPYSGAQNAWSWSTIDFTDGEKTDSTFAVCFRTKEVSQEFKCKYENACKIYSEVKKATHEKEPQKKDVQGGREDETLWCKGPCVLYRFVSEEWKKRGKGDYQMLQHKINGQIRLILREDVVLKVRMNHIIDPKSNLSEYALAKCAWSWSAIDFADGNGTKETFAIRFKTEELSQKFKIKYEEAQKKNAQCQGRL